MTSGTDLPHQADTHHHQPPRSFKPLILLIWKVIFIFLLASNLLPAIQRVPGMRSVKVYSGAGGLRADIRYVFEMGGHLQQFQAKAGQSPMLLPHVCLRGQP
jgi:hypothetical protein